MTTLSLMAAALRWVGAALGRRSTAGKATLPSTGWAASTCNAPLANMHTTASRIAFRIAMVCIDARIMRVMRGHLQCVRGQSGRGGGAMQPVCARPAAAAVP